MGSHLVAGQFKSDKYDWCPPDFVALKVTDRDAQPFIWGYAQAHRPRDAEFSADLETRLRSLGFQPMVAVAVAAPTPDGTPIESECCYTPSELRARAQAACACSDESCGVVIRCEDHPEAPVHAKYLKNRHSIVFVCAECRADLPTVHLDEKVHAQ